MLRTYIYDFRIGSDLKITANVEVDFNRSLNADIMMFFLGFISIAIVQFNKKCTTFSLSVYIETIFFLLKLILNYFLAIV